MDRRDIYIIRELVYLVSARIPKKREEEMKTKKEWLKISHVELVDICMAMRARLISIARGCKSIEELPDGVLHDDNCMERDLNLTQIYQIATGADNGNWPEAMPYEPLTEEEIFVRSK